MVDIATVEKINKLTFSELRNELATCENNPVKGLLIRKLMLMKYQQSIQKKKEKEHNKQMQNQMQRQMQLNRMREQMESKKPEDAHEDIVFDSEDFDTAPNLGPLNELDDPDDLYDTRNIKEYDRDIANNTLMDRLNSDIYIKTLKEKKEKPHVIIPPYSNDICNNYALFDRNEKVPKNDFSNRRIKQLNYKKVKRQ
jgi:hypothetical protein